MADRDVPGWLAQLLAVAPPIVSPLVLAEIREEWRKPHNVPTTYLSRCEHSLILTDELQTGIWRLVFGDEVADPARVTGVTRVSTDAGLEQDFNSLDAQREASEAYIESQAHEGWRLVRTSYDDGGFSGGSLERPALQRLLADVRLGHVDVIVVYKVDRLTRSLADFAKLVELFDTHKVSFVSVTQSFNTTRADSH